MKFYSKIRTYCDNHYVGTDMYLMFSATTYKDAWEYVMDVKRVLLQEKGIEVDVEDNTIEYNTENGHRIRQEIELYDNVENEIPFTWSIEPICGNDGVTIGSSIMTNDGIYKVIDIKDQYVVVMEIDTDGDFINTNEINITFNRLKNFGNVF